MEGQGLPVRQSLQPFQYLKKEKCSFNALKLKVCKIIYVYAQRSRAKTIRAPQVTAIRKQAVPPINS